MEIHVFSDNSRITHVFAAIERSRKHHVIYAERDKARDWVKRAARAEIAYVDVGGLDGRESANLLRFLARSSRCSYAVIDQRGMVKDPARLFHEGAVDYLGKDAAKEGADTRRIDAVAGYAAHLREQTEEQHTPGKDELASRYRLCGPSWREVAPDQEYTFWMLYVEMDGGREYQERSSDSDASSLLASFKQVLNEYVDPAGGRIWMWKEAAGLVLFPFDGESYAPVVACLRMMLNRAIINVESFSTRTAVSFRFALHVGNTTYRNAGHTGTIVSDDVNFIFHLGTRFAKPGEYALTGQVTEVIPGPLQSYLIHGGDFEGRPVYRMKLPSRK